MSKYTTGPEPEVNWEDLGDDATKAPAETSQTYDVQPVRDLNDLAQILLNDDDTPGLRSTSRGLTDGTEEAEAKASAERWRALQNDPEYQAMIEQGTALNDAEALTKAKADAMDQQVDLFTVMEDSGEVNIEADKERAEAYLRLASSADGREMLQSIGMLDGSHLEYYKGMLADIQEVEQQQQYLDNIEAHEDGQVAALETLANEERWPDADVEENTAYVIGFMRQANLPVQDMDGSALLASARAAIATIKQEAKGQRDAAFKADVMRHDRSISSGLEVGGRMVTAPYVPAPTKFDTNLIDRALNGRRGGMSAAEIKQSVGGKTPQERGREEANALAAKLFAKAKANAARGR